MKHLFSALCCLLASCMLDARDVSTTTSASTGGSGSDSGSGSGSNPTPPTGGSNTYGSTDQLIQVQSGSGSGSDACDPFDLEIFLTNCDSGNADVDGPERG